MLLFWCEAIDARFGAPSGIRHIMRHGLRLLVAFIVIHVFFSRMSNVMNTLRETYINAAMFIR